MEMNHTVSTFIEYFRERGHQPVTEGSLVPSPGDPVLFTTSGMHPLTPYLEGRTHPLGRRLVNVQRCLRTTDLDEVGDDTHLTVFEMLGSWSLGDYPGSQSLRWDISCRATASVSGPPGCTAPCSAAMSKSARIPSPLRRGSGSACRWN